MSTPTADYLGWLIRDAGLVELCQMDRGKLDNPARPKGTSSAAAELADAETRARGLARRLALIGWPAPALAMSGNGYHLQFRTALPNNAETKGQLAAIYAGLHLEFSDDVVQFDRSVRNPARLCALYGSTKRKGPNTQERPHRRSWIQIPGEWRQVLPRQVAMLADAMTRQTPPKAPARPLVPFAVTGRGDYRTLDAPAWFAAHGLYVAPLADGVHGVRCPWSAEHSSPSPKNGGDTVLLTRGDGWPGFACKHAHCDGRTIKDVMQLWGDADGYRAGEFARGAAHV